MKKFSIFSFILFCYILVATLYVDNVKSENSYASDILYASPKIYVLRSSNIISPEDLFAKRGLPYSNMIFEKRAIPYSGGIYGKRSENFKRARELPFSGGIYGKRASFPFSGGIYGKRSGHVGQSKREFYVKTRAMPMMPLSGGIYGR